MSLEGIHYIADLKEAIKSKMSPKLDDFAAADLIVKATKNDKDPSKAVELNADDDLESILERFKVDKTSSIYESFAHNIRLFVSSTGICLCLCCGHYVPVISSSGTIT